MYRMAFRLSLVVIISFGTMFWSRASFAQYVNDTAFCANVVKNECVGLIANGATVGIGSLPIVEGHRTIYFWANLSASRSRAVGLYILRNGSCYPNETKISDKKLRSQPGFLITIGAYLTSGRLVSDVMDTLSIKSGGAKIGATAGAGPAKIDASVNAVVVPGASEYRVHHYRYVICPGTFIARVVDKDGRPFPGNNEILQITVRN